MKQERAHHDDSTAVGDALDLPMFLAHGFRRVRRTADHTDATGVRREPAVRWDELAVPGGQ